jgi:hypothetical protein
VGASKGAEGPPSFGLPCGARRRRPRRRRCRRRRRCCCRRMLLARHLVRLVPFEALPALPQLGGGVGVLYALGCAAVHVHRPRAQRAAEADKQRDARLWHAAPRRELAGRGGWRRRARLRLLRRLRHRSAGAGRRATATALRAGYASAYCAAVRTDEGQRQSPSLRRARHAGAHATARYAARARRGGLVEAATGAVRQRDCRVW